MNTRERFQTHRVENQPPPLAPYDAFATDPPLREALARDGGGWAEREIAAFGPIIGGEMMELGFLANENPPRLHAYDRFGRRIDEVEFHPAWHRLLELGIAHGVPNFSWRNADRAGAHVARAALVYLHNQPEQGNNCPLTMTHACVPALRKQPELAKDWLPRILSTRYDARHLPAWTKRGNLIGMGMTEKQGGSDVRSNTTTATRTGAASVEHGGSLPLYELVGHKWFFSAPMCDVFLVLAQSDDGLGCFLLPRFVPDGTRNAIRIRRLKDKLGDRSNASAEVEFEGALGWMVGEAGRGIATIIEMVALTRQDCLLGSAAIMRQALVQAIHHARHRRTFGRRLIDHDLMKNVLADLALESEAALVLGMRVARAIDASPRDPSEAALARIATALGKYFVCKRCPPFVNEAQECLGGAGYVEESILPRLYRQAPLNSIWEGSGNIQCLDVLRTLAREPESRDALFAEFDLAHGANTHFDTHIVRLKAALDRSETLESQARPVVEQMALALQAALLLRSGNHIVADAYCQSRLGSEHGQCFGTLSAQAPFDALIERAFPDER